jgi:hypothetical protein
MHAVPQPVIVWGRAQPGIHLWLLRQAAMNALAARSHGVADAGALGVTGSRRLMSSGLVGDVTYVTRQGQHVHMSL